MIPERFVAALADRYRLQSELGHGGMAMVYLAEDLKHHRRVALKVLRPELAAILGAERFLKEIEVTASLQHPNILPLFDSGAAGQKGGGAEGSSFLYYVMPYVEGESLRDRLSREKQLPIADALRIATEVASALDYAHRHHVIHRDIKPENILLHEDQALVADFGIALALSQAGGDRLTETGLSLGTPHYMSPEQATGDRQLDERSDVYSLGCVVYEMLAGDPPHLGSTAQAVVAQILTEEPRALHVRRPAVPAHVEAAVHRALEKAPADRFANTAAFATALTNPDFRRTQRHGPSAIVRAARAYPWRRGVLVALLGTAAAVGWWAWKQGSRRTAAESESPSVAVLPFVDMSATKDQAYFGDGVAEEILNGLGQLKNLRVASRTSSFKLRDADIRTIGAQLGVGHVLEGSVRRQGDEVRITAQLVAVKDGFHLWSETFDRPMKDVFAIQDDISRAVVRELRVRLLGSEAPVPGRSGTTNVQAYNHYLTGRYEMESA